jgi:hypothetical protein
MRRATVLLHFERILDDPEDALRILSNEFGLEPTPVNPLLPPRRQTDSRFEDYWRRITRQHQVTGVDGRFKGKEPLDWKEAFTEEDLKFFLNQAGEVMEILGYSDCQNYKTYKNIKCQ